MVTWTNAILGHCCSWGILCSHISISQYRIVIKTEQLLLGKTQEHISTMMMTGESYNRLLPVVIDLLSLMMAAVKMRKRCRRGRDEKWKQNEDKWRGVGSVLKRKNKEAENDKKDENNYDENDANGNFFFFFFAGISVFWNKFNQ